MAAQFLFPVADVSPSGWTPTPLWEQLDDYSEVDFIESSGSAFGNVRFNGTDPAISTDHTFRVRARHTGTPGTLVLNLYVGSGSTTWIGDSPSWNLTDEWQTYEWTLSTTQADNITDYSFLQVRHIAAIAGIQVAWSEVQLDRVDVSGMTLEYAGNSGTSFGTDTTEPISDASLVSPSTDAVGDLLLAFHGGKPWDTVPTDGGGWGTHVVGLANGTTAMGDGTGSVRCDAWSRIATSTADSFTASFPAQYAPSMRVMCAIRSSQGSDFTVEHATGVDTDTSGSTVAVTAGSALTNLVVGDMVVVWMAGPDNMHPYVGVSLSIPNVTLANGTDQVNTGSAVGNDGQILLYVAEVASVSGTPGVPTITAVTNGGTGAASATAIFLRVADPVSEPTEPPQVAAPVADAHIGSGWVTDTGATSSLFATLDEETASDSDYIRSPQDPTSSVYVCQLAPLSTPPDDTGHVVRFRYDDEGDAVISLTVELRQGYVSEASQGTLIATTTVAEVPASLTDGTLTLTEGEAANITNYGDLFLRFVADT